MKRPLVTVEIGGLTASTPFTLDVLPLIQRWLVPNNGRPKPAGQSV